MADIIQKLGKKKWTQISKIMEETYHFQGRTPKQCRERWMNHLESDIKRVDWTAEETEKLFELHHDVGNSWASISKHLPGRTENDVKNQFYSTIRRNLRKINKTRDKPDKIKGSLTQILKDPELSELLLNYKAEGICKKKYNRQFRKCPKLLQEGSSTDSEAVEQVKEEPVLPETKCSEARKISSEIEKISAGKHKKSLFNTSKKSSFVKVEPADITSLEGFMMPIKTNKPDRLPEIPFLRNIPDEKDFGDLNQSFNNRSFGSFNFVGMPISFKAEEHDGHRRMGSFNAESFYPVRGDSFSLMKYESFNHARLDSFIPVRGDSLKGYNRTEVNEAVQNDDQGILPSIKLEPKF